MYIALPQYMELEDWAQAAMYTMINYSNIAALQNDDWRSWGQQFVNDPYLGTLNPPDPAFYDTWKPWAEQLALVLIAAPEAPPNIGISPPSNLGFGNYIVAQNGAFLITQTGNFITTQR
jgi:hypothetical protein